MRRLSDHFSKPFVKASNEPSGSWPLFRRFPLSFVSLSNKPHVDWERCARENVGFLRRAAGLDPDDPRLAALVGELSVKSPEFARWWGAHEVSEKRYGTKHYRHPVVGPVTVHYETLILGDDSGQALVTYTTEPGGESETALKLLSSWAADPAPTARRTAESGSRP